MFTRYSSHEILKTANIDPQKPKLFWRVISQSSDQRTLICAHIPLAVWSDNSTWIAQFTDDLQCNVVALIFGSLAIDGLVKLGGGANRTVQQVSSLPIPAYDSQVIRLALDIATRAKSRDLSPLPKVDRAAIDALIWLHFGFNSPSLNRNSLEWWINNQFDCLNRYDPNYKDLVISAYDNFAANPKLIEGPIGNLFTKKITTFVSKEIADGMINHQKKKQRA